MKNQIKTLLYNIFKVKPQEEKRITMVLKPAENKEFNTIFIELTPQDFANIAGLMFGAIPQVQEGGTLMIESPKNNLFFKFVPTGARMIERRSLIGE